MRYIKFFTIVVVILSGYQVGFAMGDRYQSLGLSASVYSGTGLSYRYHFENRWGFQVTGGAIIDDNTRVFGAGFEIQRDLSYSENKRIFIIMALGVYGDREEVYKKDGDSDKLSVNVDFYKAAVGFGGELAFGDEIFNHLTLGMSIYPIGLSIKENHTYPGYDNTDEVGFGASIFTHFNF